EVGNPIEADRLAEHRSCGRRTLVERICPVLHSNPLTEEWMHCPRDVAGRENVRHGGLKPLVDDHAILDCQSGVLGKLDTRYHADPDDDEVAVDRATTGGAHAT